VALSLSCGACGAAGFGKQGGVECVDPGCSPSGFARLRDDDERSVLLPEKIAVFPSGQDEGVPSSVRLGTHGRDSQALLLTFDTASGQFHREDVVRAYLQVTPVDDGVRSRPTLRVACADRPFSLARVSRGVRPNVHAARVERTVRTTTPIRLDVTALVRSNECYYGFVLAVADGSDRGVALDVGAFGQPPVLDVYERAKP